MNIPHKCLLFFTPNRSRSTFFKKTPEVHTQVTCSIAGVTSWYQNIWKLSAFNSEPPPSLSQYIYGISSLVRDTDAIEFYDYILPVAH